MTTKKKKLSKYEIYKREAIKRGEKRACIKQVKIGKHIWTIVVIAYPLKWIFGYADHRDKLIVIDGTSSDEKFLDTLVHEVGHALDKKRTEIVIKRQGTTIAYTLTEFGYKQWKLSPRARKR